MILEIKCHRHLQTAVNNAISLGSYQRIAVQFYKAGIFLISDFLPITLSFFLVLGIPLIVLGALAMVGGIYALQRKMWGLVLAGSISATLFSPIMGIAAITFTALSRRQFQ